MVAVATTPPPYGPIDPAALQPMMGPFSRRSRMSIRSLLAGVALAACLAACTTSSTSLLDVGDRAPDVTLQRLDGADFSLSAQRGKTVLLNFWFYH